MRNRRLHIRRFGMTLVELIVVIAVILTIAALAAAFLPNISDSNRTWTSVDLLEQWLLTAKMRAKRDGLPTGIRFIANASTPGQYSQFVYIQQPDPLVGGNCWGATQPTYPTNTYPVTNNGLTLYYSGGLCISGSCVQGNPGSAHFYSQQISPGVTIGVDFTGGQSQASDYLVQPGDYLELRDGGGVHLITGVTTNVLAFNGTQTFTISSPTTNYRILRQPRPVLGENPLQLPGNMVVDINTVPSPPANAPPPPNTFSFSAVSPSVSGQIDILFAPSGAVIGSNAGAGKIYLFVRDYTLNPADMDFAGRCGIVAVQTLTGYIGAYNSGTLDTQANMYLYANEGRGSGM